MAPRKPRRARAVAPGPRNPLTRVTPSSSKRLQKRAKAAAKRGPSLNTGTAYWDGVRWH